MPFNYTKEVPKSPEICAMCTNTPKPSTARILGYVAQKRIPRAPSPPATFCGFQASKLRNQPPRPPYQWSLGGAGRQHSPRTVQANGGSTVVPGANKKIFFKVVPRPLGMLNQVCLGRFEPVVAYFGPWKIGKCLENGRFQDQKWVKKMGQKHIFQK